MTAILSGLGTCLPSTTITNAQLQRRLDTSDEWIVTRTGIRERREISAGMSVLDLATHAARNALQSARAYDVDAVILATTSPDRLCPAAAPEIASRLELGNVAAFDLTSACSGFIYGLATSVGLIDAGIADTVLFIGAEAFTTMVNRQDRNTAPLFGDGAGAVVLRRGSADEAGAIGGFDLGSDGSLADILTIPAGGTRHRSKSGGPGLDTAFETDWFLQMDGKALFAQAIDRMTETAGKALSRASWTVEDVDCFIAHQANLRIGQSVSRELNLPDNRVVSNIDRVGNTLSASIPLLLADAVTTGRLKAGHRVLMTAFGAGLSWGATTLAWPDITVELAR